jgi:hypothetical protein
LWGRSIIVIGRHAKDFIAAEALFKEKKTCLKELAENSEYMRAKLKIRPCSSFTCHKETGEIYRALT